MAKMTSEIIEFLFEKGKAVYHKKQDKNDAINEVEEKFSSDQIARSSAQHYIELYGHMITGEGSTWNSNSGLLVYYVDRILSENGLTDGKNAYKAAMRFAKMKSRTGLIVDLEKVRESYGFDSDEDVDMTINEKKEETVSERMIIDNVFDYIRNKGYTYSKELISNLFLCLKTKPFVILAGISGTGKTRIVKLFAEAIGANEENGRYKMIPVKPNWSDSTDLLGYVNLEGKFVVGQVIEFIKSASEDLNNPYFLCLDEMNLARVEYYFSDFLSIIETRDFANGRIVTEKLMSDNMFGNDKEASNVFKDLTLPENLYVIGTVNMDETTFPFSKKVLDRANTIEFSEVDLVPTLDNDSSSMMAPLKEGNSLLRSNYLKILDCLLVNKDFTIELCKKLQNLNTILKLSNSHIGYRVRDEITIYMVLNHELNLIPENDAFDLEILQKVLPRIQGSSSLIRKTLCSIFDYCNGNATQYSKSNGVVSDQMFASIDDKTLYKRSSVKVAHMVRRLEEDGFTSYWL